MDKAYWTDRQHSAGVLAAGATTSQAREIHLELARRYGLEAGRFDQPPPGSTPGAAHAPISMRAAGAASPELFDLPAVPTGIGRPLRNEDQRLAGIDSERTMVAPPFDFERLEMDRMIAGSDVAVTDPQSAMMTRNGIARVPADHYHVDGYRYTNLADALAQVARGAPGRRSMT